MLEEQFIADFIEHNGYRWEDIYQLPEEATERVMTDASHYAAAKIAEHTAHTRFRREIQRDRNTSE